jgi:hypothetical protein
MSDFTIKDNSSNHIYRTELPNIIFEIGLKCNEISVYCAIKRAAGDKGECTKSYPKLCSSAGVGRATLFIIIPKLCQVNPILKKPLIICKSRYTEHGDQDTNLLTIVDIWPDNYEYFKNKIKGSPEFGLPSPELTPGVVQNRHHPSPETSHKEEPFKKNPFKKNIPPSGSYLEKDGWRVGTEEIKKILNLIQASLNAKMPFSELGISEAVKSSSPYAVQEVLKLFKDREPNQKNLKIPDRWLLKESIKMQEYQKLKKDIAS